MNTRSTLFFLILFFSFAIALPAQAERDHVITMDDYFSLSVMLDVAISPDGRYAAYVDLRWDEETKGRNGDIWLADLKTGDSRRLTFDPAFDAHPQWASDSQSIYFDSARKNGTGKKVPHNGKKQVWQIDVRGENLRAVTRLKEGIRGFQLSGNGERIYYTTRKKQVDSEWKSLRNRYSKLTYGHGVVQVNEIWVLDLNTWRKEKLVDEGRVLVAFDVSPDEERIAMITRPTEELISNEGQSTVDIFHLGTGEVASLPDAQWREQAPSPYGWLDAPSWSDDGKALAFTVAFDGYPTEIFVADFSGKETPTLHQLPRPNEVSAVDGGTMRWRPGTKDLLFLADDFARKRVFQVSNANSSSPGKGKTITGGDVVVDRFDVFPGGGSLAVVMSTPTSFGDLYQVKLKSRAKKYKPLTKINPQTDNWLLPKLQVVRWTSKDGVPVEGILELPGDYEPGKPLPMILSIHGGPTSASRFRLRYWSYGRTLMAASGFAVLTPNYRGSTGYGDSFLTQLIGRKNDIDVIDLLAGVDAMVERGIADPDRLGVMGWSNGGYLTNCLITKTDRFKAASSGAGVFDVVMQWGIEDTPGHVINFQEGLPWDRSEEMKKASPLFDVHQVKTPTIIHVGENDPRCPQEHSRMLYRSLHEYVGVPVELIVYPGEGHSLSRYEHRKAHMEWDLAWFKRYLLRPDNGKGKTAQPSEGGHQGSSPSSSGGASSTP